MVGKFLDWRFENNVDAIHHDIETNCLDCPAKFPHGELILRLTNTVGEIKQICVDQMMLILCIGCAGDERV